MKTDTPSGKSPQARRAESGDIINRTRLLMGLWSVFWLIAIALLLALLWLPVSQLFTRTTITLASFFSLLGALMLLYSLRPRGWSRATKPSGNSVPLTRENAAPLYQMTGQLARQLGIAAPVTIYLSDANGAQLQANRQWNGKLTALHLSIGLPLLGTLSEAELGATVTHEYSHFFAGKIPLAPWFYQTRQRLIKAVADLDHTAFLPELVFLFFARNFLRLSQQVARELDLIADALAAQVFGPIAARAAIEKNHLIAPMWSAYLDAELNPAIAKGVRLPIYEGLTRFCKPGAKRPEVQAAIHDAANRSPAEFDSLPSTTDRIATLMPGAKPTYPPLANCLHLLGGDIATDKLWYSQFADHKLQSSSWDNFGPHIVQKQIEKAFNEGWMNPEKLPLTELPGLVRNADDLWDKIRPDGIIYLSPQGKRNYVLGALEEWATACLIHRGFNATYHPGQAINMQRGEQTIKPADLVVAAIGGTLKSSYLKQFDRQAEAM